MAIPGAIRLVEGRIQLERAGLDHQQVDPAAAAALCARYDSELVAG